MKKVIINLLATMGTIAIILVIVVGISVFRSSTEADYKIERSIMSPAKGYEAIIYTIQNKGCTRVVAINSKLDEFSLESEKEFFMSKKVFSANCSAKLNVQWLSDRNLLINIDRGDQPGWLNLSMARTDNTGQLKIEYELAPNKAN